MPPFSPPPWLWIVFTLVGAAALTARNAMQRGLVETAGTAAAAHVRFLYGLPFAVLSLAAILLVTGETPPMPTIATIAWSAAGGISQIVATALMLAAMRERSFVVTIAYTKTEPVQVALIGTVALGDWLTIPQGAAILIASAGVMLLSWPRRDGIGAASWRPAALGIAAGGGFAFASVGFRGGIQALGAENFLVGAASVLVLTLTIQVVGMTTYLLFRDRHGLSAILREWRRSLLAGFMGATSSLMWFFAFAIQSAALVRTLGLLELLFAQAVSRHLVEKRMTPREMGGIAFLVAGVVLLLIA